MDLQNPTKVFQSDSPTTRETVEAALIFGAPTIQSNTASAGPQHLIGKNCQHASLIWILEQFPEARKPYLANLTQLRSHYFLSLALRRPLNPLLTELGRLSCEGSHIHFQAP